MDNPFPGMDPWMEQQWGDAHHSLIQYARDQIQPLLPPDLRARIEERVFVEADGRRERNRFPDLRVIERVRASRPVVSTGSAVATAGEVTVARPLVVYLADEPMTEGVIQIVDVRSGNRVVTVIEVLSPSNKLPGVGQRLYLGKQQECQAGGVNLVEIDLLRGGQWVVSVPLDLIPVPDQTPYRVCVWRAAEPLAYEIYPAPLRERLPVIRVPLREDDADVPLDLQTPLNRAYQSGAYDDTDYSIDPVPSLGPEDAAWADALLRSKGLR